MGVKGLTTFISNNHTKYLKDFKLHDCYVIIDGNSITYQIYTKFSSRAHCAFGGDYDRFAQYVKEFFITLSKCGIRPIVLFDGGYARRKVKTVINRMTQRIKAIKHLKPACDNCALIFPILMKNVTKDVLAELGIPFVQCDYEADQEIASLARKYRCPVLSYDSDFYIFDVDYIPISTLEFDAVPLYFQMDQQCEKFCMNCKLYKVEFFLNSFGGLEKSMLPLLASLLGNDYIKIQVFRKFYSQFKIPKGKGNPLQRKIARLIEWLRNETFDSAVQRVLGRMKQVRHKGVMNSITKAVKAYTEINSTVEKYLPIEFTSMVVQNPEKPIELVHEEDHEMIETKCTNNDEDMDVDNEAGGSDVDDNGDDDDNNNSVSENEVDDSEANVSIDLGSKVVQVKIPDWLCDSYHKGVIEPFVFDILRLRTYFALPQAEDNFYKCSHTVSLPLLKIISKLLVGDNFKDVSLWMRNNNGNIQRFLLHLNNTHKLYDIGNITDLPVEKRKSLFLEALGMSNDFNIDSFPAEWKLYIFAVMYWIKTTTEPQITEIHLLALLFCIVSLSLIDVKVGFFRKKVNFLKKYSKIQRKIINRIENGVENDESDEEILDDNFVEGNEKIDPEEKSKYETTVQKIVSSIDTDECVAVFDSFYQFHLLDENLKGNKKLFSTRTIHSLAQFQSCLYHVTVINSLLGLPFDQPVISHLYSGTFVYNICVALSKTTNVSEHTKTLLKYSPNILKLIETMFSLITSFVPVTMVEPVSKRSKRRRRKRKNTIINVDLDESVQIEEEDNQDSYHDANNVFSVLSTM